MPLLRTLLFLLGAAAVPISVSILSLGATATARIAELGYNAVAGEAPLTPAWPPTMDNELRFYAALFLGFGLLCLRAARDPAGRRREVIALAAIFFLGGLGRAASWLSLGPPHPVFVLLMAIELAVSPVIAALALRSPA